MAEDNSGDKLVYFLIGAGMGALAALLFAPKAGSELRADIADVTRRGVDQARDQARKWANARRSIIRPAPTMHRIWLSAARRDYRCHRTRQRPDQSAKSFRCRRH
ncbi:MAG: YtxH domain-containing protein [Blastocatellia bacterium]